MDLKDTTAKEEAENSLWERNEAEAWKYCHCPAESSQTAGLDEPVDRLDPIGIPGSAQMIRISEEQRITVDYCLPILVPEARSSRRQTYVRDCAAGHGISGQDTQRRTIWKNYL